MKNKTMINEVTQTGMISRKANVNEPAMIVIINMIKVNIGLGLFVETMVGLPLAIFPFWTCLLNSEESMYILNVSISMNGNIHDLSRVLLNV
jgi:hypothetical protein